MTVDGHERGIYIAARGLCLIVLQLHLSRFSKQGMFSLVQVSLSALSLLILLPCCL